MNPIYAVHDADDLFTPALVFYREIIRSNIAEVIRLAGSPGRLCPHVKTHKTREIARMQIEAGITHHKCATIAEAEILAQVEAPDVLVAYPVVGPNIARLRTLARRYPMTRFSALCDHPESAAALSAGWTDMPGPLGVLMDVNVGQNRTGIIPGPAAVELYGKIGSLPNLACQGLHVYDGHNHQEGRDERESAVKALLEPVLDLRRQIERLGLPAPRIVAGGTPTFPVWAKIDLPGLQCSPGTFVLHDQGYGSRYADMAGFRPAALVVTRAVSKPMAGRVTFDLGHKAVAADPPAGKRCVILNLTEYVPAVQNEEHFAVDTPSADRIRIGELFYAVPTHVCPTVALHRRAIVVERNRVVTNWEIAARDRFITV